MVQRETGLFTENFYPPLFLVNWSIPRKIVTGVLQRPAGRLGCARGSKLLEHPRMPLELHLDPQVCLIKILDPGTFIILEYGSWIPELESWITAVSALHGHRLFTV